MLSLFAKLDDVAGRLTNRLIQMTPRGVVQVPTDVPIVSFTFDDVPDTALTGGATILERYGARGTFYVAGGLAGRREPGRTLITADGCRDLATRGHEIGCHTFAHPNLRHIRQKAFEADLARNARYLDMVERPRSARNFAYPYNAGALGKRRRLARTYRTCRAGGEAINRGPTDPGFLQAVEIRQPEDHARGLTRWIDALVAHPGWLIFFTHDIASRPTPYGCTESTFSQLVAYAVSHGCLVAPVDAALDRMNLRMGR